jgi:hypothetical protein
VQEEVNRVLRSRHGFQIDLSPVEISRIVDPHFPTEGAAPFRIGVEGFDWSNLMPDFELAWVGTSAALGVIDRVRLDERWLAEERRLAEKHPFDGSGFSAVWVRR